MDTDQREEFDAQLAALFGAWGRNFSPGLQEGYWKGLQGMSLGELARCVQAAITRYGEQSDMRLPDVGGLWAIKRSLRAPAPEPDQRHESASNYSGDQWDIQANSHLLAYCMRWALNHRGPIDEGMSARLVRAKKRWAQDMRESCENGCLDIETQRGAWAMHVAQAEREAA